MRNKKNKKPQLYLPDSNVNRLNEKLYGNMHTVYFQVLHKMSYW